LFGEISGLCKVESLGGVKHYLREHPAFHTNAAEWIRLLEALEQGDEAKARPSLAALGVPG
jgi:hypothetical protein